MLTTASLALTALLTFNPAESMPPALATEAGVEVPAAAPGEPAWEERRLARITLRDGQQLRGVVVRRDAHTVEVELVSGGRVELPASTVAGVKAERNAHVREDGELRFMDPNRTRYFYAPSGMMLRKGEGYFSQKQLFFSSMNYGVTDFLTVQAGAVLPTWLLKDGFNFIAGVKMGSPLTEHLHVGFGAQGLFIPSIGSNGEGAGMGFLFGTATYGTQDAHLSVALGKPFVLAGGESALSSQVITTLSGNLRASQRLALVTENWLFPGVQSSGQLPMINALGLRALGEQWAVDLGALRMTDIPLPIPWLSFSYHFTT